MKFSVIKIWPNKARQGQAGGRNSIRGTVLNYSDKGTVLNNLSIIQETVPVFYEYQNRLFLLLKVQTGLEILQFSDIGITYAMIYNSVLIHQRIIHKKFF